MPIASVGGLISGLDTATLINQLMQVEGISQTRLKERVSTEQSRLSALQSLNSKLASLATQAGDLAKTSAWSPLTATSSSDKVTATVTSAGSASSISFTVKQTALPPRLSFDNVALTTRVTAPDSTVVHLTGPDGTLTELETGDGSLAGLVKAINGAGAGVRATSLKLADGTHRVLVQSEKTGADVSFSLTNADGSALAVGSTPFSGQDAIITVGTDELKSSTNTFSGTVSGLDITLAPSTPAGTVVDIAVTRDTESLADSVTALVDAANAILTDISGLTAYASPSGDGGALPGDATLRSLHAELVSSVANGVDGKSLADVGIEVDRYGKITFDAKVFTAAYTADPTGTANRFVERGTWSDDPTEAATGQATLVGSTWRTQTGTYTVDTRFAPPTIDGQTATVSNGVLTGKSGTPVEGLAVTVTGTANGTLTFERGFAARFAAIAERASDSTVGTVTSAVKGRTSTIDSLEDAIAGWDVRLELRRQTLTRQYAALEVALGQLQNQSQWLAGQISGLPSYDSGS
ncbi:MAG: flagellar filament capping protein FliD [Actinomycetota bacterium]|nr:flagellar filament capping protein FliD [Actinomycetota bacterium]